MTSEMRECRACKQPFAVAASANSCSRCGYINLAIDDSRYNFDWLTPAHSANTVESLFQDQFRQAKEAVRKDLASATRLFMAALVHRETLFAQTKAPRSITGDSGTVLVNAAVQLLYLLICQHGGVQIEPSPAESSDFSVANALWMRVFHAALLSRLRMREEAGEATYAVNSRDLVETFTSIFKIAMETQENSHVVEAKFRNKHLVLEEPEFYALQHAVLGYSARDYIELMASNFAELRKLTNVQQDSPIVAAELQGLPEATRVVLEAFTLTLQRVFRFKFPNYFDLGEKRERPLPTELPIEAIAFNWTSYYPFFEARRPDGAQVILFTKHAWVNALGYMLVSRSAVASELVKRAKSLTLPDVAAIRQYRELVAGRLEQRIADLLSEAKFETRVNLKGFQDKDIPEIDVIGARTRRGITEIIVIEAKDIDMPLHKAGNLELSLQTLKRGAEQLNGRTIWVCQNWAGVLQMLNVKPSRRVVLTPLLVTRRYLAPNLIPNCAVVPLPMLELVLIRLSHHKLEAKDGLGPLPRTVLCATS